MNIRSICLLAILSSTLLHCSMPSDVEATKTTSKDIDGKIQQMNDGIDNLLNGGRKDVSDKGVNQKWSALKNAANDTERVKAAKEFCSYFLFQMWTGQNGDTVDKLRQAQAQSMEIFFGLVDGLINNNFTVNETLPDNRWKILASIAVGMSQLDPDYVAAAKAANIQPDSIYTMIVAGLGDLSQTNKGQTIPGSAQEVLNKYNDAVFLLQLRHNYSAAIVVNNFTGLLTSFWFAEASDYSAFIPSFLAGWVMDAVASKPLNVQLSSASDGNVAKLQEDGINYLNNAVDTQTALNKLGIQLEFNDTIMELFTQLNFIPPQQSADPAQLQTITALNEKVAAIKTSYASALPPAQIGSMNTTGYVVGGPAAAAFK